MKQNGYYGFPLGGAIQPGRGTRSTDVGAVSYTGKILLQTIISGTAIASTAALTAFDQQPTIPKGLLNVVGARMQFQMWGVYSTTGTPTLNMVVRLDDVSTGDTVSANSTAAAPNNAGAWAWSLLTGFVVSATGGSGTLRPLMSILTLANNTTGVAYVNQGIANAISPTNTNTNRIIIPGVQWGASSASNTITVVGMSVEIDYPFATA